MHARLGIGALAALFALAAPALLAQGAAPTAPQTPRVRAPMPLPGSFPLWPAGAPGAVGSEGLDVPTITPFLPPPARRTGAAVVVFPGGGYAHLATEKEGVLAARWLNALGVAAFVVQYRLGPRYRHPAMERDGTRAVRTVRARAAEWGLDPERVGVLGFSAGGHLAGTVGTRGGAGDAANADAVERASARPDVMLLVYPVVTLVPPHAHAGSREHLLGPQPDPALVRELSLETQVGRGTPPTFLVATSDDASVPVENALLLYGALRAAGVPAELHVLERGPHGFGPAPDDPALRQWTALAATWLGRHGFLAPSIAPAR